MAKLRATNISKQFGSHQVLKEISIEINSAEIVGILGPNGAGKTTTFYIILGLTHANNGEIWIDNQPITNLTIHQRAKKGIGYLPQEKSIFRKMTTAENILAVLELRKDLNRQQQIDTLNELLNDFHLTQLRDVKAPLLSGGECRRVELARALASNPEFLLLDEPFAGVDPISIIDIKVMITQLQERGIGILITDHNVRETLQICNRAYVVNQGEILCQGSANDILQNQDVKNVYLGQNFTI
jgi:lipopolysaccharide export system ATP-binding protein